ncbi:hypothetical protein [Propionivibrio dicarboxylicus]|uniref:hypothetical protein n=1 Tax=Propionivibrio dicarboxylicus TaxID=83767 RepID=UPI0015A2902D|nr:hypothetical protein [Propionivibrio dicarboxylicus]
MVELYRRNVVCKPKQWRQMARYEVVPGRGREVRRAYFVLSLWGRVPNRPRRKQKSHPVRSGLFACFQKVAWRARSGESGHWIVDLLVNIKK